MKLINCMGCIYRVSNRVYKKILTDIAEGRPYEIVGSPVGVVEAHITDMTPEEAREKLDEDNR